MMSGTWRAIEGYVGCLRKADWFRRVGAGGINMHKYERIVFWSEEDQKWILDVPELPGCMADGATAEEALENAEIVISECLETAEALGREIPAPKGRLIYA